MIFLKYLIVSFKIGTYNKFKILLVRLSQKSWGARQLHIL